MKDPLSVKTALQIASQYLPDSIKGPDWEHCWEALDSNSQEAVKQAREKIDEALRHAGSVSGVVREDKRSITHLCLGGDDLPDLMRWTADALEKIYIVHPTNYVFDVQVNPQCDEDGDYHVHIYYYDGVIE